MPTSQTLGVPQTLFPLSCEDALIIGPRVEEDWAAQTGPEPEPEPDREASRLHRSNFTYLSSSTAGPLYPALLPGMPISGPDAERQ